MSYVNDGTGRTRGYGAIAAVDLSSGSSGGGGGALDDRRVSQPWGKGGAKLATVNTTRYLGPPSVHPPRSGFSFISSGAKIVVAPTSPKKATPWVNWPKKASKQPSETVVIRPATTISSGALAPVVGGGGGGGGGGGELEEEIEEAAAGMSAKTKWLIGGAALLGLYFLTRRKR